MRIRVPVISIIIFLLFSSCGSKTVKKKIIQKKPEIMQLKLISFWNAGIIIKKAAVYTGSNAMAAVSDVPGTIRIYTLPGLRLKKILPAGSSTIVGLAFQDKGKELTVAYADNELRTFTTAGVSKVPILTRKGYFGQLRCLTVHPSGQQIALGNGKGEILLFKGKSKYPSRKKTGLKSVNYILFSPNGKYIALSGGRYLELIKLDGLKIDEKTKVTSPVISLAFSENGKYLAAGTLFWRVLLLEADSLDREGNFDINMDPVSSLSFHKGKKWLISGSGKTGKGTLHFFTYPKLKLKKKIKLNVEEIIHIESMGKNFLIVSSDGTIQLLKIIL